MGRTSLPVDDELIEQAMKLTGARTKREAVEIALRRFVAAASPHGGTRGTKDRIAWDGNLESWRRSCG